MSLPVPGAQAASLGAPPEPRGPGEAGGVSPRGSGLGVSAAAGEEFRPRPVPPRRRLAPALALPESVSPRPPAAFPESAAGTARRAGSHHAGPAKEHLYKLLVIGDLGVGKTSIIQKRYVHQNFSSHYQATISVDFALKVLTGTRRPWCACGSGTSRVSPGPGTGAGAPRRPSPVPGQRLAAPRRPGLPPGRCAARDFPGWTANLVSKETKSFSLARGNFTCVLALCGGCFLSPSHSLPWDLWAQRGPPRDPGRPSGIALGS